MASVELDGKQDIGSLGPAIGDPWIVSHVFEVRVFDIDIGKAMTGRCEVHQPSARCNQGRDAIDEGEMAEMVGAELRLEAIGRVTEGAAMTPALATPGALCQPCLSERSGIAAETH